MWDLREDLGHGSFGRVRRGRERWPVQLQFSPGDRALQPGAVSEAAIKSVPKEPSARAKFVDPVGAPGRQLAKLRREAECMRRLGDCPHAVHLLGLFEDDTHAHFVIELCTGGDLAHLLAQRRDGGGGKGEGGEGEGRGEGEGEGRAQGEPEGTWLDGRLPEAEAAEVMYAVLKFLEACHGARVVFGDVKPANFLVKFALQGPAEERGARAPLVVKGSDFGCSQLLDAGDDGAQPLLRRRTGTPAYWAPEVFLRHYGPQADLWSAGVMMYQILCGRLPFWERVTDAKPRDIQAGVLMGDIATDTPEWRALSDEARDLIEQLLDRSPDTRPSAHAALRHPFLLRYGQHPGL